jgi:uncharacterized membrane protein
MRTLPLICFLAAGLGTFASRPIWSASQSASRLTPIFEPIDGPQAKATIASAINVHGEIVGRYTDQQDRVHAFLIDRSGAFRTLDFPGAQLSVARGLNDRGDVVGQFEAGAARHGFLYNQGKYVQLDFPGTGAEGTETFAWGISNRGDVVGRFTLRRGDGPHGFVLSGGQWKRIDHPQSNTSAIDGINDAGEMVGIWFDENQNEHSFRLTKNRFTSIDVPDATRTLGGR